MSAILEVQGVRRATGVLGLALLVSALAGARPTAAASYLYVSPTVGVWHWDQDAYPDLEFENSLAPVFGARAGYAFTQAFSGELVGLTGTNHAAPAGETGPSESLRLTQLELSLLVHFQSLTSMRVYPFLDLGAGAAIRKGGSGSIDDTQSAFHLGGGVMVLLDSRFALRANVRDTFFTDKRQSGNLTQQLTVDSLELSLGLEVRFPIQREGAHRPE